MNGVENCEQGVKCASVIRAEDSLPKMCRPAEEKVGMAGAATVCKMTNEAYLSAGEEGAERKGRAPTANEYLSVLLVGLCPLVGLVASLLMAYAVPTRAAFRNLAKALLWLHGMGLCAMIIALCVWVVRMAMFM